MKSLRTKIIIGLSLGLIALVAIPYALSSILNIRPKLPIEEITLEEVVPSDDFTSEPFVLDEGYQIELVDGWQLVDRQDRSVDRYRFERPQSGSIFTISVYDQKYDSFDEVKSARYGDGYIDQTKDVSVNGFEGKQVLSAFYETGKTTDVIVQTDDDTFVSLYGLRFPDGDAGLAAQQQVDYMQRSFKATGRAQTDSTNPQV